MMATGQPCLITFCHSMLLCGRQGFHVFLGLFALVTDQLQHRHANLFDGFIKRFVAKGFHAKHSKYFVVVAMHAASSHKRYLHTKAYHGELSLLNQSRTLKHQGAVVPPTAPNQSHCPYTVQCLRKI